MDLRGSQNAAGDEELMSKGDSCVPMDDDDGEGRRNAGFEYDGPTTMEVLPPAFDASLRNSKSWR